MCLFPKDHPNFEIGERAGATGNGGGEGGGKGDEGERTVGLTDGRTGGPQKQQRP